jgi:hypothetical protein
MSALRGPRDERGVVSILVAVAAVMLLVTAALAVDIGNTWARRGQLQQQADGAALFAANQLPAYDHAGRSRTAAAVAQYVACQPVAGQLELDPSIPDCPHGLGPQSAAMTAYGDRLLADGLVSFPTIEGGTGNYVKVVTPAARVVFGLGRAAGADESIQQREAVARVGSPGVLAPMALSLNCLLSAAGSLPAGLGSTLSGVLPLNYIAPGPITVDEVATRWPTLPDSANITVDSWLPAPPRATQGVAPPPQLLTGHGWGTATEVRLVFALGDQRSTPVATLPSSAVTGLSALGLLGGGTAVIPPGVYGKAGAWRAKVAVRPVPTLLNRDPAWAYSRLDYAVTVALPTATQDVLGCGRMIKSPRDLRRDPGDLRINLRDGLDHVLTRHPALTNVSLPRPATVQAVLDAVGGLTGLSQCRADNLPDVLDNEGPHATANCVMPELGDSTPQDFTDGILGPPATVPANSATGRPTHVAAGRLVCTTQRPCRREFSLPGFPGASINDDKLSDFVRPDRQSLLTEAMFFNLDTYLTDDLPVVTPRSALTAELYASHRFMWVPVISTPVAPSSSSYYPVLTFRPIFITQDAPAGLHSTDLVLDLVGGTVGTLLGLDSDDHGLLLDSAGTTLRAMRFMTIEPSALPSAGADYDGPLSDYVGAGPRVIRLVR